eukprot:5192221-Amphidinium_carterae.1
MSARLPYQLKIIADYIRRDIAKDKLHNFQEDDGGKVVRKVNQVVEYDVSNIDSGGTQNGTPPPPKL